MKVDTAHLDKPLPIKEKDIEAFLHLKDYNIVILTDTDDETNIYINNYCRKNGIKFICANVNGVASRVFTDFGEKFDVIDKNGEDPTECMIASISNEEKGLVELLTGMKHPYEDGDKVLITGIEGMDLLEKTDESAGKKSINGEIFEIKVKNSNSFYIGNTIKYSPYIRNGLCKNIKVPI